MKKVLCCLLITIISVLTFAQDSLKIKAGMFVPVSANTNFSNGNDKPFKLGYGLIADISFSTPTTYYNICYGFGDNSIRFITGYTLSKDWDTYAILSKTLHMDEKYLGVGIEKMLPAEKINSFIFSELGTNFKGTTTLYIGLILSVQSIIF